jgi:hypothetical protein
MKLVKAKSEAVVDLGNEAFVDPIETELIHHIMEKLRWNSRKSQQKLRDGLGHVEHRETKWTRGYKLKKELHLNEM